MDIGPMGGMGATGPTPGTGMQDDRDLRADDQLGQDEFTQILVTQLQHQDPLDPMDDREFIVQMTQFSKLEQLYNISENQQKHSLMNMLGKNAIASKEGEEIKGEITAIKNFGTSPKLEISGELVDFEEIDEFNVYTEEPEKETEEVDKEDQEDE